MSESFPDLSKRQLRAYEGVERIKMARWTLKCLFFAFFSVLLGFFYAAFVAADAQVVEWVLLLLDGVLGWSIKLVVAYLFPAKKISN